MVLSLKQSSVLPSPSLKKKQKRLREIKFEKNPFVVICVVLSRKAMHSTDVSLLLGFF